MRLRAKCYAYMFDKLKIIKKQPIYQNTNTKDMKKLLNDKIDSANIMKLIQGDCILFKHTLFHETD